MNGATAKRLRTYCIRDSNLLTAYAMDIAKFMGQRITGQHIAEE
jgi:hypothetical protein